MNKNALLLLLVVSLSSVVVAQNNQSDRRAEFYVGFSELFTDHGQSGTPLDRFSGLLGVDISGTGYISKRFGITGDFSAHFRSHDENVAGGGPIHFKTSNYNFLVGPKFRFTNSTRVTPFLNALAGVSNNRFKATGNVAAGGSSPILTPINVTDFAMALGGGLDIRVHKRISIRVFQIDYMPVFMRDRPITGFDGRRFDNFRFSTGIVF
jgi:opacity protein-like surface antigen